MRPDPLSRGPVMEPWRLPVLMLPVRRLHRPLPPADGETIRSPGLRLKVHIGGGSLGTVRTVGGVVLLAHDVDVARDKLIY